MVRTRLLERLWVGARSNARLYVLVAALGTASFFLAGRVERIRGIDAQSSVVPFVLRMETFSYEEDADGELIDRKTEARRSDGVTAVVEEMAPDSPWQRDARKITFMDGRIVSLSDLISAKCTIFMRSADAITRHRQWITHPPSNCIVPGETLLGFSTELNQPVAIISRPGRGGEVTTKWAALNLSCQLLRFRLEAKQPDGTMKLIAAGRPVSLRIEDPPATLFDEGASYDEVKPSERLRRDLARSATPENSGLSEYAERADAAYSRMRTPPDSDQR